MKLTDLPTLFAAVRGFITRNAMACIAFALAVITAFLIPPDEEYLSYFDFKTLACLFCTLAVVGALKEVRFFSILAQRIVIRTGNLRSAVMALVCVTFFGSMLIANDMALITFLPLGYYVLTATNTERSMVYVFILQNIAANLGGMLTPFGNPQNLYLYARFNIPTGEFLSIMLLPFLAAAALIVICCFLVRPTPIRLHAEELHTPSVKKTVLYLVLFALSILLVFRLIPWPIGLAVVTLVLLFTERRALKGVDYGLLLTFVCFFNFAGNLSRVEPVKALLSGLLTKNPLLVSVASCQFISNVPSAILLSRFTEDYRALLMGVNIGGTGTIIASLASLITFRQYVRYNPGRSGLYLKYFAVMNAAFLVLLTGFCLLIL